MKVSELLRGLADIIDASESQQEPQVNDYEEEVIFQPEEPGQEISNRPNEIYTSLEIIDNMGNDVNGPVKPEQVKTATFPMFFGMNNG